MPHFRQLARLSLAALLYAAVACTAYAQSWAQSWTVGMNDKGDAISATSVPAQTADAQRVVVIGSLSGDAASSLVVQTAYESYANASENFLDVSFIAAANPGGGPLQFPPIEPAYSSNWGAWSLWHFLASVGPDAVIIIGEDQYGLAAALGNDLRGLGPIPVYSMDYENELIEAITGSKRLDISPAHTTLLARASRTPAEVAAGLANAYGQQLGPLTYIPAMALIGKLRLDQLAAVETIVEPTLAATEQMPIDNSLQIAGHLLFAELAERSGNPRYLALARRAADLGFDAQGKPLEAMPFHGDYSDAFFMHTPLLAKVGKLTGEQRYFDMALRHVEFLAAKLQRADGLYNHWPRAAAAWGRGNAFVALGLALALTDIPQAHPAHARLLALFQQHIASLLPHQNPAGMWHNIIDMNSSWPELSATAMLATAIQRGVDQGWLEGFHQFVVDSAWQGVLALTDNSYSFTNVCESTPGQATFADYLNRKALSGQDDRAGGMMLLLATERLQSR